MLLPPGLAAGTALLLVVASFFIQRKLVQGISGGAVKF